MNRYGKRKLNYINHVALVLDASGSMQRNKATLIKVADQLVKHLAKKSTELDQETRVTIYGFDDTAECLVFDKDVLRLPSIADLYWIGGMTALLDATALSIMDLRQTMTKYGDHAFLTYVLTDGAENASVNTTRAGLKHLLTHLEENETVACLVPDQGGVEYAKECGFPAGNVAIWEISTREGLEEAASKITRSVDTYMTSRVTGVRSSKNVFASDLSAVNKATVNSKTLVPLPREDYVLLDVKASTPSFVIREFVEATGAHYSIGKAYYQLTKTEVIQAAKGVALQNIHSGRIYTGQQARDVLGLKPEDTRVKPAENPEYRIYVQSTSVNRKLIAGTKLLLLK